MNITNEIIENLLKECTIKKSVMIRDARMFSPAIYQTVEELDKDKFISKIKEYLNKK